MNVNENELNKVISKLNNWCSCNCNHIVNIFVNCITVEQKLAMLKWAVAEIAKNQALINNAFIELKKYVDEYFNNLNIENELTKILEDMKESGELENVLNEVFSGNIERSSTYTEDDIQYTDKESTLTSSFSNYYLDNIRTNLNSGNTNTMAEKQNLGVNNKNGVNLTPGISAINYGMGGDPIGAIAVLASYLNNGITYGRDGGMFNSNGTTFNQMVCSDYLWCAINGIPFRNSKAGGMLYNAVTDLGTQHTKPSKSLLAPVEKDALITREIAMILAANGCLNKVETPNMKGMMPGDIIFYGNKSSSSQVLNNYLTITHCGLVVSIDYDNKVYTSLECGVIPNFVRYYISKQEPPEGQVFNEPVYVECSVSTEKLRNYPMYYAHVPWSFFKPCKVFEDTGSFSNFVEGTGKLENVFATNGFDFKKNDVVKFTLICNLSDSNPTRDTSKITRLYMNQPRLSESEVEGKRMWRQYLYNGDYISNVQSGIGIISDDVTDFANKITFRLSSDVEFTFKGTYSIEVYRV